MKSNLKIIKNMCRKDLSYLEDNVREEYLDFHVLELREELNRLLEEETEMDKDERKLRLSILKEMLKDAERDRDTFFED